MSGTTRQSSSERFHHLFLLALVGMGIAALSSTLGYASANEAAGGAGAKRGEALFHQHCITCHNKEAGNTSPFGPPNLHGIFRQKVLTPPQAVSIIRQGRGAMPPWGKTLSDGQINDLISYLKTQ